MPQVPEVPLDDLYGAIIIGHYRDPRHRGQVPDADVGAEEFNPFCGDGVKVRLKLDHAGVVTQVGAVTEGCSIIQASASMMGDVVQGKTLQELRGLARRFRDMMGGKLSGQGAAGLPGDLQALQVVCQFPVRIKCALLPWTALEEALSAYEAGRARPQSLQ